MGFKEHQKNNQTNQQNQKNKPQRINPNTKIQNYKQLPIREAPKEGARWESVQKKDSFNEYLINKNGLLSAMLFLLRDGFLSSIGQQNVSVVSECHSI